MGAGVVVVVVVVAVGRGDTTTAVLGKGPLEKCGCGGKDGWTECCGTWCGMPLPFNMGGKGGRAPNLPAGGGGGGGGPLALKSGGGG